MQVRFSDEDIAAKAVELGLIRDGEQVPRHRRSQVAAVLVQEAGHAQPRVAAAEPQLAKEIVVQPGGAILVDGEPFPWLVAQQPMEIGLNPDGISTVRLTLMAQAVQIIKPEPRRESE
ncbi:hypothetical protein [Streptomyces sp. NPDC059015]|uniref:hypothetical protein n=1 Tax=unclassified Streptomyces TaxID=2593676 RepID=UPI003685BC73